MTYYARSAYGSSNPNAGYPANGDVAAWGGYCWPAGVPTGLLGSTSYTSAAAGGQVLRVTMRRELVPLWDLVFQIQDVKHGYPVYARRDGEAWGPWGYDNRPISGTQRPSGHSAALSVDENAPYNPYSYTFQSNMPPAMVADMESLGLYWGGRYEGQKYDPMHFGFCRAPSTVAGYIEKARAILGTAPTPTPPEDEMTPADWDKMQKMIDDSLKKALTVDLTVSTDDAAADGNPNRYTLVSGVARVVRLTSLSLNKLTGNPDR